MKYEKASMMLDNLNQLGRSIDLFIIAANKFEHHENTISDLQEIKSSYELVLNVFKEKRSELDLVNEQASVCTDLNVLKELHGKKTLLALQIGGSVELVIDIHRAARALYQELRAE